MYTVFVHKLYIPREWTTLCTMASTTENKSHTGFSPLQWVNGTALMIGSILLLWQAVALVSEPHQFPGIVELGEALAVVFSGSGEYRFMEHVPLTLARIVLSVIPALVVGLPIGILMGRSDIAENYLSVYVLLLLAIPALVWAFLGALWFGITTYLVPVFVGVLILLPYSIINAWEGTKDLDADIVEMADVFGASRQSVWRNIYLPHLLPYIFSTTRTVVAVAWKIMLVAEIFGTQSGLGYVINAYFLVQRNDMILAWSIPVMLIIFGFDRGLRRIERHKFAWRANADTDTHVIT